MHTSKIVLKIFTRRLECTGKDQFGFYLRDAVSVVYATAMWLAAQFGIVPNQTRQLVSTYSLAKKIQTPGGHMPTSW